MINNSEEVDEFRCCPHIETAEGGRLPVVSVECEVQVNVVVATVRIKIVYRNTNNHTVSGLYKAPNSYGSATVTSCDLSYGNYHLVTAVVDPDVVNIDDAKKDPTRKYQDLLYFMLPFQNLGANSEITVDLCYIQNLEFTPEGFYELVVPLYVANHMMLPTTALASTVSCKLDAGTSNCSWEVMTHAMTVLTQDGPYCALRNADSHANSYFHLRLNALSNAISCSCCVQPNDASINRPGGSFMTFVSPPENRYLPPSTVGRKMVFLFDRSGSMTGLAIQQAAAGLIQALKLLQPEDSFALCAFNHEEDWFLTPSDFDRLGGNAVPTLYSVTVENVGAAIRWVGNIQAGGLTNILSPYQNATLLLSGQSGCEGAATNKLGHATDSKIYPAEQSVSQLASLPFIFLLTDGAVQDEVSICQYAETHRKDIENRKENSIRTFTFGIGPFVNPTFLKTLAAVGRGHSHINLHPSTLETAILGLMNKSTRPLLMDITLLIASGGLAIEVYPFPIPDLYKGCPVAVAGSWTGVGAFPSTITVCGRIPGGGQVSFPVDVRTTDTGFLNKALGSFRIDSIVSAYWMKQNNDTEKAALRQKAIDASIEASIPCVFTQSVAYQTSETNRSSNSSPTRQTRGKGTSNTAAMVGGTAILLGAFVGLMMFGNVGATNNNFNVSSALDSIANGAFDPSLFDVFKIPGVDIGSFFGSVGGAMGDAAGFIGDGLASGVEAIQRVDLQDIPSAIGDIANNVGSPGDINSPDCCDTCCSNVGDGCDGCCGAIGACCGGVGACCESSCTGLEAVCGALDGLGSVGDFGGGCVIS